MSFFLFFAMFVHAGSFRSPASFRTGDCERQLLGGSAVVMVAKAGQWLSRLAPHQLRIIKTSISPGSLPPSEVLNPRLVWFAADPETTSYEQVAATYLAALRESHRFYGDPPRPVELRPERPYPLTAMEMAALGVPGKSPLQLEGLVASVSFAEGPWELQVQLRRQSEPVGGFVLPLRSLRYGFRNSAAAWQARHSDSTFPPDPSYVPPEKGQHMEAFFRDEGVFMLIRRAQGQLFAFTFSQKLLERVPEKPGPLEFEIFTLRSCSREEALTSEFVFPAGAGGEYPCLQSTGLRLSVPYGFGLERTSQPPGWSERRFVL